jgi:hypothetical protein
VFFDTPDVKPACIVDPSSVSQRVISPELEASFQLSPERQMPLSRIAIRSIHPAYQLFCHNRSSIKDPV